MSITMQVNLKEIYRMLCKKCKEKFLRYVAQKITLEQLRKQFEE